jgi:hypothetical protein
MPDAMVASNPKISRKKFPISFMRIRYLARANEQAPVD